MIIRPFKGLRFDDERVSLEKVLSEDRDSRSVHHLLDPQLERTANENDDAYSVRVQTRAQGFLAALERAGVVVDDEDDAFYLLRSEGLRGEVVGFLGRTESESKEPVSAVVGQPTLYLYNDEDEDVERSYRTELERECDLRFLVDAIQYELWIVDDETTTARMQARLGNKTVSELSSPKGAAASLVFCANEQAFGNASLPVFFHAPKVGPDVQATLRTVLESRFETRVVENTDSLEWMHGVYEQPGAKPLVLVDCKDSNESFLNTLYKVVSSHVELRAMTDPQGSELPKDEVRLRLPLPNPEELKDALPETFALQRAFPKGCVLARTLQGSI